MQISKPLFLVCAATALSLPIAAGAKADNQAQSKARQALEQAYGRGETTPAAPVAQAPAATAQPAQAPAAAPQSVPAPAYTPKADSEAIARAREAVRQKWSEIEAGRTTTPAAAAAPAPAVEPAVAKPVESTKTSAPAVATTPAPRVSAPVAESFSTPPAQNNEAVNSAREALRKKMRELEAQQPAMATTPAPGSATTAAPTQAQVPQPETGAFADVNGQGGDAAAIAKAREALRKQTEAAAAQQASTRPVQPSMSGAVQYPQLEAPALPFSQEKQAKLAELLRRYRADELSPDQYHAERAKIIAAP